MRLDLIELHLQLCELPFHFGAMRGEHREEFFELRPGIARAVVHIDDFFGLSQREASRQGLSGADDDAQEE